MGRCFITSHLFRALIFSKFEWFYNIFNILEYFRKSEN